MACFFWAVDVLREELVDQAAEHAVAQEIDGPRTLVHGIDAARSKRLVELSGGDHDSWEKH